MEKKIVGHYEGKAPFATITFRFAKIDAKVGGEILKDLKIEVGVCISEEGRLCSIDRSSLSYQVRDNALAVIVCYDNDGYRALEAAKIVKQDVEAIAAAFEAALSVFDV